MNKKRYLENYEEGSELLWPDEKEDKITRNFYQNLSHLSNKIRIKGRIKRLNLFEQILLILKINGTSIKGNSKNNKFN